MTTRKFIVNKCGRCHKLRTFRRGQPFCMECCKKLRLAQPPSAKGEKSPSKKKRAKKVDQQKPDDGRTYARCPQCKRQVEIEHETRRFVDHRYLKDSGWPCPKSGTVSPVPGAQEKAGKRKCPVCAKWLTVTSDGRLRSHQQTTGVRCAGSGGPPAGGEEETASSPARRRPGRGSSVYAITTGLPGLGKRR